MVGIVDSGHVFLFFFMEGMNVSHATIGSMDLWYVYLHKWLIFRILTIHCEPVFRQEANGPDRY